MIPKVIHYCWFGGNPLPESAVRCIESWKKHCPDFEIRQWTEKDFDITQNEYTKQAYEVKAWGFVPDYIRLWIIYNYGGVYLDTDVQVVKDLTPLLEHSAYAGFEDEKSVNFGQGFGAEKGNPAIYAHMKMYDTLRFVNEDGSLNRTASPRYTTLCLKERGLKVNDGTVQQLDGITIYPTEYFCPKDFVTGETNVTNNTYSIHQFDASWYSEEGRYALELKRKFSRFLPRRIGNILATAVAKTKYQGLGACIKWVFKKREKKR